MVRERTQSFLIDWTFNQINVDGTTQVISKMIRNMNLGQSLIFQVIQNVKVFEEN